MPDSTVPLWLAVPPHLPQSETLRVPRSLVNQLLHLAQLHPIRASWGIISAHDGLPTRCHLLGEDLRLIDATLRTTVDALAQVGECLWAAFRTDPDQVCRPTPSELECFGTSLFLTISLGIQGVLQLRGWRTDQLPKILELEIEVREYTIR